MARFSSESVDRVRQAADIVEIVNPHTDLRRQGDRWVGLCPFHEERTPSFSVNAHDKLYYCFGCERGGDVFRFVQEKEGMEFPEAVELLAERYGVELQREREDPRAEAARQRRARLGELLERTAGFYASYLWGSGEAAKARGELEGGGFGARALRKDQRPKYLNSPEGELYRKSHTLYGIDRARAAIAKAGRAIVVEGYTDVLALHQAGITEAGAGVGGAHPPGQ